MWKKYTAYIKDNPEGYWFKRKLYGWGWTPAKWQGWVTLLVFIFLIVGNGMRSGYSGETRPVGLLLETAILAIILLAICYKTGESPKWQWGTPEKYGKENASNPDDRR